MSTNCILSDSLKCRKCEDRVQSLYPRPCFWHENAARLEGDFQIQHLARSRFAYSNRPARIPKIPLHTKDCRVGNLIAKCYPTTSSGEPRKHPSIGHAPQTTIVGTSVYRPSHQASPCASLSGQTCAVQNQSAERQCGIHKSLERNSPQLLGGSRKLSFLSFLSPFCHSVLPVLFYRYPL